MILLIDGVCNLCNSVVGFVAERDPKGLIRFAQLQSDVGRRLLRENGLPEDALASVVLIDEGRSYQRSDAALRVAQRLSGAWPALGLFRVLPRFLRDGVYELVARNRYRWFGKADVCLMPTKELLGRFIQ